MFIPRAQVDRLAPLTIVCGIACSLWQRFVCTTGLMGLAVREKEVDKHSDDWEEEDNQAPEDLMGGWVVGLQNLD